MAWKAQFTIVNLQSSEKYIGRPLVTKSRTQSRDLQSALPGKDAHRHRFIRKRTPVGRDKIGSRALSPKARLHGPGRCVDWPRPACTFGRSLHQVLADEALAAQALFDRRLAGCL